MYVRKKNNKSGSVSVYVLKKEGRKDVLVRSFGSSKDPTEVARLHKQAHEYIQNPSGQPSFFSKLSERESVFFDVLQKLDTHKIQTIGPELIFGTLFDRLGFNAIPEELFKHITVARLAYPTSKLKTVDYLKRYSGEDIEVHTVYRFLDRLVTQHKSKIEQISYDHTKKILQTISVVFYDMTTLYFETEDEDE